MSEFARLLFELIFDSANIVPAAEFLTWAMFYSMTITLALVVLREHMLSNLHYRLRGGGGLWRVRLTEETNLLLDDLLAWFTPTAAFGTIDSETKYDRACALTPVSVAMSFASAPARFLRPTPFKILVVIVTLTHCVPAWPVEMYRRSLPHVLTLPTYLQGLDLIGLINRLQASTALFAALLCGGAFALYRAALRRRASKLEDALEYSDRIAGALKEILNITRKNINTLHARLNDLPSYFPPSESDEQLRWHHPALGRHDDFSVHFASFEEYTKKITDSLTHIEEENLTSEYFEVNRRAWSELLSLGLYSAESAGRLPRELLDASYVEELFGGWFSQLNSHPKKERDQEIKKRARSLLADVVENEVKLTRFLRKIGRAGILKRTLFGLGSLGT